MTAAKDTDFWCHSTTHRAWQIVELGGDLDWTGAADVRRVLCRLQLPLRGRLAVDMRALTFMDSTGIRLILQALHLAEERDAEFAVIRGPNLIHNVLELVGLDEQLRIVEDMDVLE
jgi:anti-anti-sigma factor